MLFLGLLELLLYHKVLLFELLELLLELFTRGFLLLLGLRKLGFQFIDSTLKLGFCRFGIVFDRVQDSYRLVSCSFCLLNFLVCLVFDPLDPLINCVYSFILVRHRPSYGLVFLSGCSLHSLVFILHGFLHGLISVFDRLCNALLFVGQCLSNATFFICCGLLDG